MMCKVCICVCVCKSASSNIGCLITPDIKNNRPPTMISTINYLVDLFFISGQVENLI